MKKNNIIICVVLVIVIIICIYVFNIKKGTDSSGQNNPLTTVVYSCDNSKSITATYFEGQDVPVEAGNPPVPTGKADISFDGGEIISLNQTLSGSGVRYANSDESLVFWNKGNEALVMRSNAMDLAYTNCKAE